MTFNRIFTINRLFPRLLSLNLKGILLMTSLLIFLFLLHYNPFQDYNQSKDARQRIAIVDSIVQEYHENVTGMSYQRAMQKYILEPAKLYQTGFISEHEIISNYSGGYFRDETGIKIEPTMPPSVCFSAGMMYSTAKDLHRFVRILYRDKKILSDHFTELMTTQHRADYGLGVFTGYQIMNGKRFTTFLHMGEIHGYTSQVSYFPENDYTVIILDNTQQCPSKLYFTIMDLLPDFYP